MFMRDIFPFHLVINPVLFAFCAILKKIQPIYLMIPYVEFLFQKGRKVVFLLSSEQSVISVSRFQLFP